MKHSSIYIKWFCRSILILLVVGMTYMVTRNSYNYSHWLPHNLFRSLHIPYNVVLYTEQNLDKALHFFGAAILVWLMTYAHLYLINKARALLLTWLLCLAAEVIQSIIGRGFNSSDLLLGMLGGFMAYLVIKENKHRPA